MQPAFKLHQVHLPGIGATSYAVAGSGPPVLLLHGLGATHAIWRLNVPSLASLCTVYAPDLPGHGDSARPRVPYTLDFGVRFTTAFMDAVGLSQVILVGSSLGGLLALATAVRHSDRVAALALASPAGLGRELARGMRWASVPVIGPLLAAVEMRFGPGLLPSLVHRPEALDPDMAAEIHQMASAPGVRGVVLSVVRHGVALGGLRPSLVQMEGFRRLSCPVLLVWGAEDRIIPVAHAYRAREARPETQVYVLPECGHLPQIEKAGEFNQRVSQFLQGVSSSPATLRQASFEGGERPLQ
jgi:pimeloyl-ACP methyl ester carboxylesterase